MRRFMGDDPNFEDEQGYANGGASTVGLITLVGGLWLAGVIMMAKDWGLI